MPPTDIADGVLSIDSGGKRKMIPTGLVAPLLIPDTEAASLAGVSRATWHRLRAAGKLPPQIKLGRSVRWRRSDVLRWIECGCPDAHAFTAMQTAASRRQRRT